MRVRGEDTGRIWAGLLTYFYRRLEGFTQSAVILGGAGELEEKRLLAFCYSFVFEDHDLDGFYVGVLGGPNQPVLNGDVIFAGVGGQVHCVVVNGDVVS